MSYYEKLKPNHINNVEHFQLNSDLVDKLSKIPKLFKRFPRSYEVYLGLLTLGLVGYYRNKFMRLYGPRGEDKVLDFGCGTGANLEMLAEGLGEKGQIVGLDINRSFLDFASDRIKRKSLKQVRLLMEDVLRLPEEPYFDKIYVLLVMTGLKDREVYYRKFQHLLKPHGKLIIGDYQQGQSPILKPVNRLQNKTSRFWNNDLDADLAEELSKYFKKVEKKQYFLDILYVIEASDPREVSEQPAD